eukprot:sb/3471487/
MHFVVISQGEDSLSITTTLLDCPKDKITIHCKKDARTSEIIRKAVLKLGWNEKDAYKYALVEVYDPRFGMRRSQPALNTAVEHSIPYVKLRGIMEQPVLIKAGWIRKEQTRYLLCPRGVILRKGQRQRDTRENIEMLRCHRMTQCMLEILTFHASLHHCSTVGPLFNGPLFSGTSIGIPKKVQ